MQYYILYTMCLMDVIYTMTLQTTQQELSGNGLPYCKKLTQASKLPAKVVEFSVKEAIMLVLKSGLLMFSNTSVTVML